MRGSDRTRRRGSESSPSVVRGILREGKGTGRLGSVGGRVVGCSRGIADRTAAKSTGSTCSYRSERRDSFQIRRCRDQQRIDRFYQQISFSSLGRYSYRIVTIVTISVVEDCRFVETNTPFY